LAGTFLCLRYTSYLATGYKFVSFDGGSLRNAIPREASVVLAVEKEDIQLFLT
jgi:hypothetical protein